MNIDLNATYNGNNIWSNWDAWLEANATYEGYGEWSYTDYEGNYSITENEACGGYDVSCEYDCNYELCLTAASDDECYDYFS